MNLKGKIAVLSAFALLFSGVASGIADNSEVFNHGNIISASAEEVSETDWKNAYADFLKNGRSEQFDGRYSYDTEKFALAYIDNDDIPELVLVHGNTIYGGTSTIFTYSNGSIQLISDEYDSSDFGTMGYLYYSEKSGIIRGGFYNHGRDEEYYYKIENNKAVYLCGKYVSDGTETPEGTKYCVNSLDNEVSESEYEACVSQYNKSNEKEIYYDDIFTINDENIAKYLSVESTNTETASGQCGENVTWSFDETTGTLTISGSGDMYDYSENNPEYWKYDIKNLIIKDGVTSIGAGAFAGDASKGNFFSFESVVIPDSVKKIGAGAFFGDGGNNIIKVLEAVSNSKVEEIDSSAFHWSNGSVCEKFTVPETVKSIGDGAFAYSGIASVVIPENLSYENIKNAGFGYTMDGTYICTYYGYKGSDAEKFVNDMNVKYQGNEYHDLKFVALDEPNDNPTPETPVPSDTNSETGNSKPSDTDSSLNSETENSKPSDTDSSLNSETESSKPSDTDSSDNAENSSQSDDKNNYPGKSKNSPSTGDNGITAGIFAAFAAAATAVLVRRKKK